MNADQTKQKRNRVLSWAINLAGLLILVLILYLGGLEAWQQIIQGDWRYVLAAFASTFVWNLVAAYRWQLIANRVAGTEICPYRYFVMYHMIGMLVGQVVPITVGMLGARPVALSLSQKISLRRSALSVFLDKLFDLILALLLVVPIALYLAGWIERPLAFGMIGAVILVSVFLIAWQFERAVRLTGQMGSRVAVPLARLPGIGRRLIQRLPQQLDRLSSETFLQNSTAVQAFLLTLVMYALLAIRHVFIAQALHLEVPWYLLAMGVAITQLTLIFSVTPGSLGFLEAGWGAMLSLAGLTLDQITTFVIGRRAYVLVFTVVQTLMTFAWIREGPARLFRAVMVASRQPARELETAPATGTSDDPGSGVAMGSVDTED